MQFAELALCDIAMPVRLAASACADGRLHGIAAVWYHGRWRMSEYKPQANIAMLACQRLLNHSEEVEELCHTSSLRSSGESQSAQRGLSSVGQIILRIQGKQASNILSSHIQCSI